MPIPSFDELFANREAYFKKDAVDSWNAKQKEDEKKASFSWNSDKTPLIQKKCKACIPTGANYDNSETPEKNIKALKDEGQLAFLWVHINDILTLKEFYGSQNFKHTESERNYARDVLALIKRTLLEEMQNAKTLEDLIAKKAFLCADLSGMSLNSMVLDKGDFRHANLGDCDFNNTSLAGADLQDANLENADLSEVMGLGEGEKASGLFDINLRGANLSGAKYKHADIMAVETNPPKGNFYQTRFGTLPKSYDKNPAEKQALENKVRESYEAVKTEDGTAKYNPTFLKLIQASGFSPLEWGYLSEIFEDDYKKWTQRNASQLLGEMKKTLGKIVDPNDECGYEQSRSRDTLKFFCIRKKSRSGQITELTTLKNTKDLTIDQIADGLLKVSNDIRFEGNTFKSELLNLIEGACTNPEVKGPMLEL